MTLLLEKFESDHLLNSICHKIFGLCLCHQWNPPIPLTNYHFDFLETILSPSRENLRLFLELDFLYLFNSAESYPLTNLHRCAGHRGIYYEFVIFTGRYTVGWSDLTLFSNFSSKSLHPKIQYFFNILVLKPKGGFDSVKIACQIPYGRVRRFLITVFVLYKMVNS